MSCTGIAASWCPECGDCTCVHEDDELDGRPAAELAVERMGWLNVVETIAAVRFPCRLWCVVESKLLWRGITMDFNGALCRWIDPACPLHGDDSRHAECQGDDDMSEKMPDHEAAARQIMERGPEFATRVMQKLLADLGGHQAGWMLALPSLPSPPTPAGLLEQLTRSLVLIESRAGAGPGEAKRALELLPADYVASIRRALVEEPRPDIFEVLDEVSAELQADGVKVGLDEFKQNRGDDLP